MFFPFPEVQTPMEIPRLVPRGTSKKWRRHVPFPTRRDVYAKAQVCPSCNCVAATTGATTLTAGLGKGCSAPLPSGRPRTRDQSLDVTLDVRKLLYF